MIASRSKELVTKLRIAVVAELLFKRHSYHIVLQKYCRTSDPDFIDQEIFSEMRAASKDRAWCDYVSFAALATILSRPIRLVHPIYSVPTSSGFAYNPHSMNDIILPARGESRLDTITVLFCGNADQLHQNPAKWRANHFVLLIDPSMTPTATPNLTPTSSQLISVPFAKTPMPEAPINQPSFKSSASSLFCQPSPSFKEKLSSISSAHDSYDSFDSAGSSVAKRLTYDSDVAVADKFHNPFVLYPYLIVDSSSSPATGAPAAELSEATIQPVLRHHKNLFSLEHLFSPERVFLSTQAIFDILSSPDVVERSVHRIPTAPKSNCYFILNLGPELTDYDNIAANCMKVQDRLRDGTGGWDDMSVCNSCCFSS